jgi:hypothetical protein
MLLWTLLGPVTIAGSLGTPVQTIAIKRYTTPSNRGFAFSLFYSCVANANRISLEEDSLLCTICTGEVSADFYATTDG